MPDCPSTHRRPVPRRLERPLSGFLVLVAAAVALYACAPTPVEEPPEPPPEEVEEEPDPAEQAAQLREQADAALEAGDHGAAARIFLDIAGISEEPSVVRDALLHAAEIELRRKDLEATAEALGRLRPAELEGTERIRYRLAHARLALERDEVRLAASHLERLPVPPPGYEATYHELAARVAFAREDYLEAVTERIALEEHLERTADQEVNRERLWDALARVPVHALQERREAVDEEVHAGWLELADIARTYRLRPQALGERIEEWEAAYPEHPALQRQVPELIARYRERVQPPERVALLLPLSGDFGEAARAVRSGILAAYYANDGRRPELTVHDTRGEPERTWEIYKDLAERGVDQVIGPLTKEELEAFTEYRGEGDDLSTPVLALNTLPEGREPPEGLYQFGLEPEREAEAAAEYARAQGWETVVVLTPRTAWGDRVGEAFSTAFEKESGIVLEAQRYNPEASDFAGPIREVLNLDASERRHRQLVNTLNRDVETLPRRRQDVDGVFLAAFPAQARVLRPQLEFHHAQDLPVLSTSHVYAGRRDPDRDRDLDGLVFLDGPWLIDAGTAVEESLRRTTLLELWEETMERYPRLVALGIDAYRVVPYLEVLRQYENESVDGFTGQLRVRGDGRVERQLVPARFQAGEALFRAGWDS